MTPQPAPLTSQPQMPMALSALAKSGAPANLLPPMPRNGAAPPGLPPAPAPAPMPPPAMPAPAGAPPAGMPTFPPPSAPAQPPFKVKPQADGSLAIVWPAPDGSDFISQVFPKPKTPQAFQPPKQPQQ